MPMLQAILLSAGDFARGALHAKKFPEPIRMQLLDFYSHDAAVEISRMTDLIRMQFLALHARMMKDKHQRMKERGFYKVSVAKRTVIRQCNA